MSSIGDASQSTDATAAAKRRYIILFLHLLAARQVVVPATASIGIRDKHDFDVSAMERLPHPSSNTHFATGITPTNLQ